jgi:hypothetical protein
MLNNEVSWLNFCFHIHEIQGSNLDPELGYPDLGFFLVFFSPSAKMSAQYFKISRDHFFLKSYVIHHPGIILTFDTV